MICLFKWRVFYFLLPLLDLYMFEIKNKKDLILSSVLNLMNDIKMKTVALNQTKTRELESWTSLNETLRSWMWEQNQRRSWWICPSPQRSSQLTATAHSALSALQVDSGGFVPLHWQISDGYLSGDQQESSRLWLRIELSSFIFISSN